VTGPATPSSVGVTDLSGYSRAMYSNWLWHRPLRVVIDAGEGLALALGSNVFAPDVVALTHGHSDHVLGLPGFAGARRFGKGAQDKSWTVIYPAGSAGVEAMRTAMEHVWPGVTFPIAWIPIASGTSHALGKSRHLEAFAVIHVPSEPVLGYRVLEVRRRLREEYKHAPAAEVEKLVRHSGREQLMEEYRHVLFVHSGDAMPIEPTLAQGADLLVHDATFLAGDERREPIHATSEEALQVARAAGVRTLVLNHLSIRYDRSAALARLRDQVAASGFIGGCWLLDEREFVDLKA
jgi:ribonuclease Z